MLPFLNVLNVGIVAALAAIEEIPAMMEMRTDRKKAFLTLSDFLHRYPPPAKHSFPYHFRISSITGGIRTCRPV